MIFQIYFEVIINLFKEFYRKKMILNEKIKEN